MLLHFGFTVTLHSFFCRPLLNSMLDVFMTTSSSGWPQASNHTSRSRTLPSTKPFKRQTPAPNSHCMQHCGEPFLRPLQMHGRWLEGLFRYVYCVVDMQKH